MPRPVDGLPPIHPGVFLREALKTLRLSARRFAAHIHVSPNAVTEIINGQRGVSAQMAIRLGRAFGTSDRYWINLQTSHDLKRAMAEMPAEALEITPLVQNAA